MASKKQIESLTDAQLAQIPKYRQLGIEIGLATGPDMDEEKVRQLTDAHRIACGVAKATKFLVFDSPLQAISKVPGISVSNALYGQHDIHWLIYYQYMRVELGVTGLDTIQHLLELCKHCGWMWMDETTTIVTRRPQECHMIEKDSGNGNIIKVLHNYNGLALKYRDGTGVYSINGTRIPKQYAKLVTAYADDLDVEEILAIDNTEIRTEFLKKVGIERAFSKLGKKLLDTATLPIGGKYELFSVEMGSVTRLYLRGECPSNGEPFFEAVHPDSKTVHQALSFRNCGSIKIPFTPPIQMT